MQGSDDKTDGARSEMDFWRKRDGFCEAHATCRTNRSESGA